MPLHHIEIKPDFRKLKRGEKLDRILNKLMKSQKKVTESRMNWMTNKSRKTSTLINKSLMTSKPMKSKIRSRIASFSMSKGNQSGSLISKIKSALN